MAGSEWRYCADRYASLCAYLHGAGTRIVPGQFQYKWHILKVNLMGETSERSFHYRHHLIMELIPALQQVQQI